VIVEGPDEALQRGGFAPLPDYVGSSAATRAVLCGRRRARRRGGDPPIYVYVRHRVIT
jgi:hypothetical protein